MRTNRRPAFAAVVIGAAVLAAMAGLTHWWPLTAAAIGFVFGFALQRGRFCGASILSSVVLFRERDGVVGAGVAVATGMLGFTAMAALGWIAPNPKPFVPVLAVVGGLVFGCGMVLAGGCVTGSLFKAGEGRLVSMLAVVGIAIGGSLVAGGPLRPVRSALAGVTGRATVGPGLDRVLGIPFPLLGGIVGGIVLVTLLFVASRSRKKREAPPLLDRLAAGGWSFTTAGLIIGMLGWVAYLASAATGRNYPLGATEGVLGWFLLLAGGRVRVQWWMAILVLALVAGSSVSAWLRGELRFRSADKVTLVVALFGGVLVGAGAVLGHGCFVGHVVSGWALLSLQSLLFGACMVLANWATTVLYLRGLR